ncbi:phosphoribosylformylglycinamidine cyclo-ligase [Alicyclobacillus contaminans]|uniref:phosphoribosylformylglycinamidine cyclo-ligase n=1 Tax=Alicyclobacillus contaminans TaxID=392016 RepID=UPI0004056731|nr:phosphoribosylformylglycinamidine cyclo-ligase [Alicyclobacillus contaminans]GMA50308.1 phosphoribosylformylglycinamidine cyclo-ligase [Alicyclobacillus contaminans]
MNGKQAYQAAGVDIDRGNAAAKRYAGLARATRRPEVLGGIGGFSGGFLLNLQKYPEPVLVSGTDGVGTKLHIAFATGRHDTVGVDCVAMSVNDILTSGAEPLFFLDYLAVQRLDVDVAAAVVAGVAEGCKQAGCALIGGETAEMSDLYQVGQYDLAGTAIGVVNRPDLVDGRAIVPGDVVIGLESNGVHSNGYSLVRKLLAEAGVDWNDSLPGWRGTVADELLRPTAIYVSAVQAVRSVGVVIKGMAHITGGGLPENLPRCLPDGVAAVLQADAWPRPAVFDWLMQQSGLPFTEAAAVWNLGIGYVLVVAANAADATLDALAQAGQAAHRIGRIISGSPSVQWEA